MNYPDKISYLTLAVALLLEQNGRCPLGEALTLVPFTPRVRRLAEQLIEGRAANGQIAVQDAPPEPSERNEVNQPRATGEIETSSEAPPSVSDCSPDDMHPGVVSEIKLLKVELRCPGCGSHRNVVLDTNQQEHLRVRGHLEMFCGYCEAPSLWEFSREAEEEPAEVLV